MKIKTNQEFKNIMSEYSIDQISQLNIEINLKKGCGVEIIDFYGEYKGHRYTINGGDEVKWFETEYEEDMDTFIEEVEDEEIYDLENTLSFNFFPSDSYGFYGKSIKWEDGTPDNIINEINDEGFDNLLSECIDNGDYDSVDTELNGDSILSINISFNYNGSNTTIEWLNIEEEVCEDEVEEEKPVMTKDSINMDEEIKLMTKNVNKSDDFKLEISEWENGQIKEIGCYLNEIVKSRYYTLSLKPTINKIEIGLWRSYYENGQLKSRIEYNINGCIDPKHSNRWYYENGQIRTKRDYKNGKVYVKCWDEKGNEKDFE